MVSTRKDSSDSPRKLKFKEKLIGKGFSTDVLLKKLKALHAELADLEQGAVDTKPLVPICKELISHSILLHKDKGVKAHAACCLSDMLRLFAPDAPFTDQELQDIFQFFFRQLSVGLKGTSEPYYDQYFYLLESLANIKSIVLICDLPHSEDLMVTLFRDFFTLVRNQLAKNIEMFMAECLIAIIDEAVTLPQEVLETIMAQFMDKNARMDQPAYRLAVEVCKATSDKLQRNVCQYFTDNIVHHAQAEDYEEVEQCHALIKRLNAACPALLHNVIPQLEEELRVEEVQLRVLATQVLGEMFADTAGGELEKKYPSTWALWLQKRNDRANSVRLAFVEGCKSLLIQHRVELREDVEESLQTKCIDPDDKVRAAVCKMIGQLDYETALHHISDQLLKAIGERCMDKKLNVRDEALKAIGRLYSLAYSEVESNEKAAVQHFAWIPSQILTSLQASLESRHTILKVWADYITPLPSKSDDEGAWTERLLTIMQHLSSTEVSSLIAIMNIKRARPSSYEIFLSACEDNNGGIIDENEEIVKKRLTAVVRGLSVGFPDPRKAADDLQSFADLNEQRLYKLLKICMDPSTDLKGLIKASSEFARRLEQSSSSLLSTMTIFLRQASYWIINTSSIPTLVKKVQKMTVDSKAKGKDKALSGAQLTGENARLLLVTISKCIPELHKTHLSEYFKAIADDRNPRLVECCLQALGSLVKSESSLAPSEKKTIERLERFARGSSPRQVKYATRVLAFHEKKEDLCLGLVDFIAKDVKGCDTDHLAARIAALKEIVRFVPDAFEHKSDVITEFLVKEVLLRSSGTEADDLEVDDEWAEMDDLPSLAEAKILAIKVCRHRCLSHSQSETGDIAKPVLNMLVTLLENNGTMPGGTVDLPTVKSRLRLEAAISILHLSTVKEFSDAITPHFLTVALTIQDSCFEVRERFLDKLLRFIQARKLPVRFNIIPFLTAHDPADELREKAKSFVLLQMRRSTPEVRYTLWESSFIRLLHALAHHPDFGLEDQQVLDMAKYIQLYVSLAANADNVSFLYHLAQKCKTIRDAESHTFSENLYALSEVAQELIKAYCKGRQWSLQGYPGKVKLPSEIFRGLPSDSARKTILTTQYLSEHLVNVLLEGIGTTMKEKPKVDRKPVERKQIIKRKASAKTNGTTKRQRRPGRPRKRKISDNEDSDDGDGPSDVHSGLEDDPISDSEKENRAVDRPSPSPSRGTRRSARAQAKKAK